MNERIKELEKALAEEKAKVEQTRITARFNDLQKYIGLVYYHPHVSPRETSFSLVYIKNIQLQDNKRLHVFLERVNCQSSSRNVTINVEKDIEYYDIFTDRLYPMHTPGTATVSMDAFKVMKHRAKTSVKSFMEIMKTLSNLYIPSITADNMSDDETHESAEFEQVV